MYHSESNMQESTDIIAGRIPAYRAYTKKQLRFLLVDPQTNPDAPTCRPISHNRMRGMVLSVPGILKKLKLNIDQYDRAKMLSATQCEIIFRELL